MSTLGGSPLGLIGVKSRPTADGMSTFNGGRSRNVNVNLYNSGKEGNKEKLSKSGLGSKGGAFSLFSGDNFINPWGNINKKGNEEKLNLGIGQDYSGVSRRTLHNNDIYDTSIINLVDKTANTAAQLRPADFAYLKNLGVFPNNRLMIARRFGGPAPDDIYGFKSKPIAVLISWKPTSEDFLDISFGEEWTDAKADFTAVLNSMGEDLIGKGNLGSVAGAGFGAVPLPGWSEGLIQNLLSSDPINILDESVGNRRLQVGNPNLIKEAKRRKTIDYGQAGSGLTCKVNIKMTCEYEQKFISGIDPTIAYMDILSNITRFGTSPSVDYGLDKNFSTKIKQWVSNPKLLVSDISTGLKNAVESTVEIVRETLDKNLIDAGKKDSDNEFANTPKGIAQKAKRVGNKMLDKLTEVLVDSIAKTVQKYEEEVKGIANALTLSPSTPWHITLGNPLRPTFCSGDMLTTDVQLILGPNLAFNDLPSSIKVEFTLTNARNWGLQEIMAKFNTGHLRTVNVVADSASLNPNNSLQQGAYYFPGVTQSTDTPVPTTANSNTSTGSSNVLNGPSTTTKENIIQTTVNSNPNSNKPPVQNEPQKTTGTGTGNETSAQQQSNKQGDSQQDPMADANATSKRGYTYVISNEGGSKIIKVVNKEGLVVLNKTYTLISTATDSEIINDAKTSLNDK